jgi:hypothetical protein
VRRAAIITAAPQNPSARCGETDTGAAAGDQRRPSGEVARVGCLRHLSLPLPGHVQILP